MILHVTCFYLKFVNFNLKRYQCCCGYIFCFVIAVELHMTVEQLKGYLTIEYGIFGGGSQFQPIRIEKTVLLASDWLTFETHSRKYCTLLMVLYKSNCFKAHVYDQFWT